MFLVFCHWVCFFDVNCIKKFSNYSSIGPLMVVTKVRIMLLLGCSINYLPKLSENKKSCLVKNIFNAYRVIPCLFLADTNTHLNERRQEECRYSTNCDCFGLSFMTAVTIMSNTAEGKKPSWPSFYTYPIFSVQSFSAVGGHLKRWILFTFHFPARINFFLIFRVHFHCLGVN